MTGDNSVGQQGNGTKTNVTSFAKRAENVKDFSNPTTSNSYINTSGDLYMCGSNSSGAQGSGDTSDVTTFTRRFEGSVNAATLTITPTPNDAVVTINSATTSSADIRKGMGVEWSVAATGYVTQTGTIEHLYDDTALTVELENE